MRKAESDDLLGTMLDAHDLVSDLNITVDRPLQVEASGELVGVPVDPPLENLTPFQTETFALNLINNDRLANPNDIPIKPGEVFVIKIPTESAVGYQNNTKTELPPAKIDTLRLRFYIINFGDGTGYLGNVPMPERVHKP